MTVFELFRQLLVQTKFPVTVKTAVLVQTKFPVTVKTAVLVQTKFLVTVKTAVLVQTKFPVPPKRRCSPLGKSKQNAVYFLPGAGREPQIHLSARKFLAFFMLKNDWGCDIIFNEGGASYAICSFGKTDKCIAFGSTA